MVKRRVYISPLTYLFYYFMCSLCVLSFIWILSILIPLYFEKVNEAQQNKFKYERSHDCKTDLFINSENCINLIKYKDCWPPLTGLYEITIGNFSGTLFEIFKPLYGFLSSIQGFLIVILILVFVLWCIIDQCNYRISSMQYEREEFNNLKRNIGFMPLSIEH